MSDLNNTHPVDIVRTFLGAHPVTKDYKGREDEYIDYVVENVMTEAVKQELAEFCDIFCEKNVFSVKQSKRLLLRARDLRRQKIRQ